MRLQQFIVLILERETLGAAGVGGTLGIGHSISILWTNWSNAIPSGTEIIHTVFLAFVGAIVAILGKILFRWLFPRNKK